MSLQPLRIRPAFWPILGALFLLASLYLLSIPTYVLFHSLAEIFAIVVSGAVFTLTWNTRRLLNNNYLLFAGIALLAASIMNSMHTLSYRGMGVFEGDDANLPTQLWIARRYLESVALLSALWFLRRKLNPNVALVALAGIAALLLAAIFGGMFPAAYVDGVGLTRFKKVSEYVIAGIFLAAAYGLYRQQRYFEPDVARTLVWSLVIAAGAELLFTLYAGVYDMPNRLGHFLTILSYYLIYVAIVKTGIVRPYTLLSTANASLSQRETALRAEVLEREQTQAALVQQSEWLRSLHEIDEALLRGKSLTDIAAAAARSLLAVTQARRTAIGLFQPKAGELVWLGSDGVDLHLPERIPLTSYWLLEENRNQKIGTIADVEALPEGDIRRAALLANGIRCYTGVPLVSENQTIGAIVLGHARPGPLPEEVHAFLRQVADQLAVAIHQARLFEELQRSREQLRSLSHHLVSLQESERKELSRELHDRTGQSMTALKLWLLALKRTPDKPDVVRARVDELIHIADTMTADLHDLALNLRPSALDRFGLAPAIEQYLGSYRTQNQVDVGFSTIGLEGERPPADVETAIYRIVQESLTNVVRHARATHVSITVERQNGELCATIEDNGRGFDVDDALARGRLGLLGMRERAEMLGATLDIESKPGAGTRVHVEAPERQPVLPR